MEKKATYIVITGAAGFIGSNIVEYLNKKKKTNLILVDHLNKKKKENLKNVRYWKYFDKKEFLKRIKTNSLPSVQAIIHMGACSDTREYNKSYLKDNNYNYSKILFDYAKTHQCQFIYASSGSVYGNGRKGYKESAQNLVPLNPYGYYKLLFDKWVLKQREKPLQWVGLRFFNVYGPNEDHKESMASVVYHGFNQIGKTGKMKLFRSYNKKYKDGLQLRDFIYIADVVKIVYFFLGNPNKSGIFNVGTGKARSFVDLANATFKAINKKPSITFIDMPIALRKKYQYFTQADIRVLQRAGYMNGFTSLEKGVREYVQKYLLKFQQV